MFLLVPAHPGCPGQIPHSRKTVVYTVVFNNLSHSQLQLLLTHTMTSSDGTLSGLRNGSLLSDQIWSSPRWKPAGQFQL